MILKRTKNEAGCKGKTFSILEKYPSCKRIPMQKHQKYFWHIWFQNILRFFFIWKKNLNCLADKAVEGRPPTPLL